MKMDDERYPHFRKPPSFMLFYTDKYLGEAIAKTHKIGNLIGKHRMFCGKTLLGYDGIWMRYPFKMENFVNPIMLQIRFCTMFDG